MNVNTDVPFEDDTNIDEYAENIALQDLTNNKITATAGNEQERETWLLLKESNPFKKFFYRVWYGPDEPSDERPTFPLKWQWTKSLDEWPLESFQKRFPNKTIRFILLTVYCSIWFVVLFAFIHPYLIRPPYLYPNNGTEKVPILSLSCNSYLNWEGTNNACGLDAKMCGPFDGKEYLIRCPALCDRGGWTYSAVAVGPDRIKYRGYEIGGGPVYDESHPELLSYPYRADSYPCAASVHAGVISPLFGGCAKLSTNKLTTSFPPKEGKHGTGYSIAFDSFFPGSYSFKEIQEGIASGCYDPRLIVVMVSIIFGLPVFYIYESIYGFWINTIVAYWVLVLALDPPLLTDAHDSASVYQLFSVGFQRLLPLCFVLYVVWKCAVKRTLGEGSPLAKIILWYPTFWLGTMNNITFDRLPVDRLTAKDLKEQAGALTAVGSIAATILVCAIIQAYSLWKSGRFRKYFKIYISMICGLVVLGNIPGLNLRIHHYILGTMLVPGCATRGSSAYLFQGILVGLILSGVSRWDFASIVETDVALLRGEAGALLKPPSFVFNTSYPHSLSWIANQNETDHTGLIDGYSLLINDFEAYVGKNTSLDLDILREENEELSFMINEALSVSNGTVPLYLRLARASVRTSAKNRGDYTNAGILEWPNGNWTAPEPGVS